MTARTVGIIPAAGKAARLHGLPKFLLPVPHRAKTLIGALAARMVMAGATTIYTGVNRDTQRILNEYSPAGIVTYRSEAQAIGGTVLAARQMCGDATVVYGLPDTFWTGDGQDSLLRPFVLNMMGLVTIVAWPATGTGWTLDVEHYKPELSNSKGYLRVRRMSNTDVLTHQPGVLIWNEEFWEFIREDDTHLALALVRALHAKRQIKVCAAEGAYYDCNTLDDYRALLNGVLA